MRQRRPMTRHTSREQEGRRTPRKVPRKPRQGRCHLQRWLRDGRRLRQFWRGARQIAELLDVCASEVTAVGRTTSRCPRCRSHAGPKRLRFAIGGRITAGRCDAKSRVDATAHEVAGRHPRAPKGCPVGGGADPRLLVTGHDLLLQTPATASHEICEVVASDRICRCIRRFGGCPSAPVAAVGWRRGLCIIEQRRRQRRLQRQRRRHCARCTALRCPRPQDGASPWP
mmetsp:Transcript_37076/g.107030  ORF Transcript_37076/g.107030 Transcript_37076/m.107030 type:complete len:227 (+) Transcript_37076:2385-3065(+)